MADYHPQELDKKWQKRWADSRAFEVDVDTSRPKFYCLEMFAYPSGHAHVGHVRNYMIGDIMARTMRMRGYNVLHPFGWDAFGLPAENAAIRNRTAPAKWTYANIYHMRAQLKTMGYEIDWSCEFATCSPDYYVHEQRMFVRLMKKGLAYRGANGDVFYSVRGFPGPELLRQIRRQPSGPLLQVLRRRLHGFRGALLEQRRRNGERLAALIEGRARWPGRDASEHTFWIFPILSDQPAQLIAALQAAAGSPARVLANHTLTADDVAGPFVDLPGNVYARAELDCLCYESLAEKLGERFHATPELLAELNPGVELNALAEGDTLMVPSIDDMGTDPALFVPPATRRPD